MFKLTRTFKTSLCVALTVWTSWFIIAGPQRILASLHDYWAVTITMIFGSMVAGATSMGGGAVAFPVLTKVLQVVPIDAKIFSLAIQSIGMSAASIVIVAMRIPVEWRIIFWGSLGGVPGIMLSTSTLAPLLPSGMVKMCFTMMLTSFGIVLIMLNKTSRLRNEKVPFWRNEERLLMLVVGFWGGFISGLVGSGMDVFAYSVMVLLFNISEKIGTPTSVIMMAINAVTGFLFHSFILGDFQEPVMSYWIAAIPVVVVGAPVGAMLCNRMTLQMINKILLVLIAVELITSLLFVKMNSQIVVGSIWTLGLFVILYYRMSRSKIYISPSLSSPITQVTRI